MHLLLAAIALAGFHPGDTASIDVSVATLWKAPNLYRTIDRPSVTNPADPEAWSRNLATTADRVWLDAHVQTQALYAQQVTILAVQGAWAKVAVRDEPDPQDPHGYPGWLPVRQLAPAFDDRGQYVVVRSPTASVRVGGRAIRLSYGTRLPVISGTRVR